MSPCRGGRDERLDTRLCKAFDVAGSDAATASRRILRGRSSCAQEFACAALERFGVGIAELQFDVLGMALHGFATDTKLFRDVADALFRGNQGKYCQFAIAQEV